MQRNAIILAAGKGTRMQSELPKVLHEVHGRPMLQFVVDAVQNVGARPYVVVGFGANQVREAFDNETLSFVEQREQLGTGHAVQQVVPLLEANADSQTVVLAGDCPLIRPETLQLLFDSHQQSQAAAELVSYVAFAPRGPAVCRLPPGCLLAVPGGPTGPPELPG